MITPHSLTLCGLPVFPCNANKQPAIKDGFHSANLAPSPHWNYPLIGLPIPADIVVLDLDTHKGITTKAIDSALNCQLDWSSALIQNTPSGGAHYAFSLPAGATVRQSVNLFKDKIGEGFDTRTSGRGYICTGDTYPQNDLGVVKLSLPEMLPQLPAAAIEALKPVEIDPAAQVLPQGDKDSQEVAKMLACIDPDCDYAEWRNVAMALKHYFHDDDALGLHLFTNWSATASDKYDPNAVATLWGSISALNKHGQPSITMGTVVTMARKGGYIAPPEIDAGAVFSGARVACDSFGDLVGKINAEAGQTGAIERLTSEIRGLSLSPMQRQEAIAVLDRALRDHGYKIPLKDLREAATPNRATAEAVTLPVPETVEFMELPVAQMDALSGNNGQSAGFIYDSLLDGRMIKFGYGSPFWWSGNRWQAISEDAVTDMVSSAYGRGEYAKRSYVTSTAKTLISNLPKMGGIGAPDKRLYFRNGVLDPVTGEMTAHNPANANSSVLGVDYDPAAECPQWDAFVAKIFADEPEREHLLYEILGWLICSHTLGIEKAVLFHGATRAGKGVIIEVLTAILGDAIVPVKLGQLAKDKPLSSMRDALVAVDSDSATPYGPDAPMVHSNFNIITANEPVSVPLLFTQEPWRGQLNCKLFIACNDIPVIKDDSGAAPKRWLPLLFNKSFEDRQDSTLKRRLAAEAAGVAAKAVEGLKRLITNDCKFSLPQSSLDQIVALTQASSPVVEFISDCIEITPTGRCHSSTLYDAYRTWATRTGNNTVSRNRFTRSMKTATQSHGVTYHKSLRTDDTNGVATGFDGLKLKDCAAGLSNVTPISQGLIKAEGQ